MNLRVLEALLRGLEATVQIALGAWLAAIILGMLISVLREVGPAPVRGLASLLVHVLRAIPDLVLLYVIYFGVFGAIALRVDPVVAAIIALGIAETGTAAEYFRGALASVPQRQREAAASLGLTELQILRKVVIPQAIPVAIPPMLTMFLLLTKVATLASAVGAPEILYVARENMVRTGEMFTLSLSVLIIYVVLTIPLARVVDRIDRRLRSTGKIRRRDHYATAA